MKYSCLIVDDEPLARKVLQEYLEDIPDITIALECSSAVEAIKYLKTNQVHIIFLDVNMPRLSGFQMLDQLENAPEVIFTTAYPEFAVDAFEVNAFDYLVKPISFDRFLKSCNRIVQHLENEERAYSEDKPYIIIKENKRLYKVLMDNIHYAKAFGDYVRIFASDKTYITKDRLHNFGTNLPQNFLQVHRSFIVNLNHIEYLEGNHLRIKGEKIPVSESYKTELLKRM